LDSSPEDEQQRRKEMVRTVKHYLIKKGRTAATSSQPASNLPFLPFLARGLGASTEDEQQQRRKEMVRTPTHVIKRDEQWQHSASNLPFLTPFLGASTEDGQQQRRKEMVRTVNHVVKTG
jgi:hypothetical protein